MNWILVEVQLYKQLHPSQMTWDIFLPPQASVLKQQLTPVLNDGWQPYPVFLGVGTTRYYCCSALR